MLSQQTKTKIEQCYDARNWLCIALMIIQFGKLVIEYIKEHKKRKQDDNRSR